MDFRFGILGPTRVRIGDQLDDRWGHAKVRGMLAVLLLHPRRWVAPEMISDWVWADGIGPERATFRKYADRIRDALKQMNPQPLLRGRHGMYRLDVDRSDIDYYQVRDDLERGRERYNAGDHAGALRVLEPAIELWNDTPLADLQGVGAQAWRDGIGTVLWLPACDVLLQALAALGRHDEILRRLDDLPVDHYFDLTLAKHRLLALYAIGRGTDAVTYFHHARRHLRVRDEVDAADRLLSFHTDLSASRRDNSSIPPAAHLGVAGPVFTRTVPNMVGHDVAHFVGRDHQLDALDAAVRTTAGDPQGAIVIIDGAPGVGKTTLAVHWANRVRSHFSGGTLFIDLHGFSDRAAVHHATVVDDFLLALGHTPDSERSQRAKDHLLRRLLAGRPTLVILDNVRHRNQVRDLLPLLNGCVVLLTSRQRLRTLGISVGARRATVEPLTAAESSELLTQLSGQRPISDDDRAHLVRLCAGSPLAIGVLTAYLSMAPRVDLTDFTSHVTPRQLIVDLGEYGTDAIPVDAVFRYSYDALTEQDQHVFRLLSLHPGPEFGLDAAHACTDLSFSDTQKSLAALVDAHLVDQPESFHRFRYHDLLGDFAKRCAELDESEQARHDVIHRLIAYYFMSATRAAQKLYPTYHPVPRSENEPVVPVKDFTNGAEAYRWFTTERTNLTAAITLAADVRLHHLVWRLVDPVATFFDRHGNYTESCAVREVAVASARSVMDREGEASALVGLAVVHMQRSHHAHAERCLNSALRLVEQDGHERGQASTLLHLGRLELLRGNPAAAMGVLERGLAIVHHIDDHEGLCWYQHSIAQALRGMKQHKRALACLHQAQYTAQQIGERSALASVLIEIGYVHHNLGDDAMAVAHCEHALDIADAIPDVAVSGEACIALAVITSAVKSTADAVRYAERAVAACHQSDDEAGRARALEILGDVYHAAGEPQSAAATWKHAAHIHHQLSDVARANGLRAKIDTVRIAGRPLVSPRSESSAPLRGCRGDGTSAPDHHSRS